MESEIERIKEVLEGWKKGELTDCAAICVIHDTLYPATIDQEDIDWARSGMEKDRSERKGE